MKVSTEFLERVRRSVIRRWSLLAFFVLVVGMGQLLLGRFYEVETHLVLWLCIHLVPGSVLVYTSFINKRYWIQTFSTPAIRLIKGLITLYLLFCLLTLLYVPLAIQLNHWILADYMNRSYMWLSPIHLFLLIGIFRLFIRRELDAGQTYEWLLNNAKEAWKEALKHKQLLKAQSLEAIANGNIEEALANLSRSLQNKPGEASQLAVISGTYRDLQKKQNQQMIDEQTVQKTINSIIQALINLADTIDHQTSTSL